MVIYFVFFLISVIDEAQPVIGQIEPQVEDEEELDEYDEMGEEEVRILQRENSRFGNFIWLTFLFSSHRQNRKFYFLQEESDVSRSPYESEESEDGGQLAAQMMRQRMMQPQVRNFQYLNLKQSPF